MQSAKVAWVVFTITRVIQNQPSVYNRRLEQRPTSVDIMKHSTCSIAKHNTESSPHLYTLDTRAVGRPFVTGTCLPHHYESATYISWCALCGVDWNSSALRSDAEPEY